jgi:hypothetical protein
MDGIYKESEMTNIVQWNDIAEQFVRGSLLLGNGASIAVSNNFAYKSLFQAAKDNGYLTDAVQSVFDKFGVDDFELILRRLWQAKLVNEALDIENLEVVTAYENVRTALISTVRAVHVTYEEAESHLQHIAAFSKQFKTILSLNYDLILYWAAMYGNGKLNKKGLGNWFKDCFNGGPFHDDWAGMRGDYGAKGTTLYFYPHGNLVLYRKGFSTERKLVAGGDKNLLDTILNTWEEQSRVPLFVCEGLEENKRKSISSSDYLERVFYEVIPSLKDTLVIYGWGFGDQDEHILEQVKKSGINKVAVSVRNGNEVSAGIAENKLNEIDIEDITFFDSASQDCWNNPPDRFLEEKKKQDETIIEAVNKILGKS